MNSHASAFHVDKGREGTHDVRSDVTVRLEIHPAVHGQGKPSKDICIMQVITPLFLQSHALLKPLKTSKNQSR